MRARGAHVVEGLEARGLAELRLGVVLERRHVGDVGVALLGEAGHLVEEDAFDGDVLGCVGVPVRPARDVGADCGGGAAGVGGVYVAICELLVFCSRV